METPRPHGTGGTLYRLRDRVGPRVVTANADLLSDLDPRALVATHERLGRPATIAARRVAGGADLLAEGNRAVRLLDRHTESRPGVQFLGMAVFERRALELLPGGAPAGLTEALLRPLVDRGQLAVHLHDGYALDVGTLARYLQASLDLLALAPPPPEAPPGRLVPGRHYVGPGAEVRAGALGRGAVVLRGAVVSEGARVVESVVWPGEHVGPKTMLNRCVFAAGTALPVSARAGPCP